MRQPWLTLAYMDLVALLQEAFCRLDEHVEAVCDGLDAAWLHKTVVPGTNPIGWLLWHQARQHDAQIAHAFGSEQVWTTGEWPVLFHTDPAPRNLGYGHTPEQVAEVRPESVEVVLGYQRAVNARTMGLLERVNEAALAEVFDTRWNPPVTRGVRIVSVLDDAVQHCGQAKYLRGLLDRS